MATLKFKTKSFGADGGICAALTCAWAKGQLDHSRRKADVFANERKKSINTIFNAGDDFGGDEIPFAAISVVQDRYMRGDLPNPGKLNVKTSAFDAMKVLIAYNELEIKEEGGGDRLETIKDLTLFPGMYILYLHGAGHGGAKYDHVIGAWTKAKTSKSSYYFEPEAGLYKCSSAEDFIATMTGAKGHVAFPKMRWFLVDRKDA